MARKYKLTGCAKFFFFFIIAAPIAYLGASYYNGQDPVKEVSAFFQSFSNKTESSEDNAAVKNGFETNGESIYQENELMELEIRTLKSDLNDCKSLNEKKGELIDTQKKEIRQLKQQLEAGK